MPRSLSFSPSSSSSSSTRRPHLSSQWLSGEKAPVGRSGPPNRDEVKQRTEENRGCCCGPQEEEEEEEEEEAESVCSSLSSLSLPWSGVASGVSTTRLHAFSITAPTASAASTIAPVRCDLCRKMFSGSVQLQAHLGGRKHALQLALLQAGPEALRCVDCSKHFSNISDKERHILSGRHRRIQLLQTHTMSLNDEFSDSSTSSSLPLVQPSVVSSKKRKLGRSSSSTNNLTQPTGPKKKTMMTESHKHTASTKRENSSTSLPSASVSSKVYPSLTRSYSSTPPHLHSIRYLTPVEALPPLSTMPMMRITPLDRSFSSSASYVSSSSRSPPPVFKANVSRAGEASIFCSPEHETNCDPLRQTPSPPTSSPLHMFAQFPCSYVTPLSSPYSQFHPYPYPQATPLPYPFTLSSSGVPAYAFLSPAAIAALNSDHPPSLTSVTVLYPTDMFVPLTRFPSVPHNSSYGPQHQYAHISSAAVSASQPSCDMPYLSDPAVREDDAGSCVTNVTNFSGLSCQCEDNSTTETLDATVVTSLQAQ